MPGGPAGPGARRLTPIQRRNSQTVLFRYLTRQAGSWGQGTVNGGVHWSSCQPTTARGFKDDPFVDAHWQSHLVMILPGFFSPRGAVFANFNKPCLNTGINF